jgi:hypothetical protein
MLSHGVRISMPLVVILCQLWYNNQDALMKKGVTIVDNDHEGSYKKCHCLLAKIVDLSLHCHLGTT